MSSLTCITCQVGFKEGDQMREHYKSDWHRYNLKRKVAAFPPVSAENFQQLIIAQKSNEEKPSEKDSYFCDCCHKKFFTYNTYESHLNSKKHRQSLVKYKEKSKKPKSKKAKVEAVPMSEDEENVDDLETDSDEWEDEEEEVTVEQCLFCR